MCAYLLPTPRVPPSQLQARKGDPIPSCKKGEWMDGWMAGFHLGISPLGELVYSHRCYSEAIVDHYSIIHLHLGREVGSVWGGGGGAFPAFPPFDETLDGWMDG